MALDLVRTSLEGLELDAEEASELERRLVDEPRDVASRARLLAYYGGGGRGEFEQHARHVLWFIRFEPRSELAGPGFATLHKSSTPRAWRSGLRLWRKHLRASPRDVVVLTHAAGFLIHHDIDAAIRLYLRAARLAPRDVHILQRIGQLYLLKAERGPVARRHARRALVYFQAAQRLRRTPLERFYGLDALAQASFVAGQPARAGGYARAMLRAAARYRGNWNHGNAIHHGHQVLGRLALRGGDIAAAKNHLLASAKTSGSPQLNSFGPSFALASELLDHGAWGPVDRYLVAVGRFWSLAGGALEKWRADLARRSRPDFDAAFLYR